MNQLTKRIIAGTMALAIVGSAAPISNYLGIKTAITASAEPNRRDGETINFSELDTSTEYRHCDIQNDTSKTLYLFEFEGTLYVDNTVSHSWYNLANTKFELAPNEATTGGKISRRFGGTEFSKVGDNAYMSFDTDTSTLTYSGTGAITRSVYMGFQDDLIEGANGAKKIVVEEGITELACWITVPYTEEIILPDTLTTIGTPYDYVFSSISLKTLTIPASVKSINEMIFFQNWGLESVYFEGNRPEMLNITNQWGLGSSQLGQNVAGGTKFYYPEGDSTWEGIETELTVHNWNSYKPASKVKEVPVQNLGSTVTINDSLNMNFFMDIPDDLKDKTAIMASVNGGEAKSLTPELVDGTTYQVTVEGISAKDAAAPIEICAVDKNDSEKLLSEKFTTSVKDYLVAVYKSADDTNKKYPASTKAFVTSILNYCDTAEKYFDLDTTTDFELDKIDGFSDSLAEIAQSADDILNKDNMKNAQVTPDAIANADDYRYMGSSLLLKSKLALRTYYKAESGADTSVFNGCKDGIELYYFEIKDISPLMFDTDINGYSIFSYIKQVLSSENTDASLKDVCTALYTYGELAGEYQMQVKDDDET